MNLIFIFIMNNKNIKDITIKIYIYKQYLNKRLNCETNITDPRAPASV